jgi:hypothetical protein
MTNLFPLIFLIYLVPFLVPMSMPGWPSLIGLCAVMLVVVVLSMQPAIEGTRLVGNLAPLMAVALFAPGFIAGLFTRILTLMYERRDRPGLVVLAQVIGGVVVPVIAGFLFFARFPAA